ncbi:MAG: hypothetical protein HUU10_04115 [Bacteroidetes bacterium]|nr:hypothetical protein [Bacteroidota bacterium]
MKPKSFEFRLDRTAFSKQSLEEADQSREWWLTRSGEERIVAGLFLTYLAYGIDPENPPPLDRTAFRVEKRSNQLPERSGTPDLITT